MRFFTEHPASVGETYGEHFVFAVSLGGRMVLGGLACVVHGIVPELCKTTGSRTIRASCSGVHVRVTVPDDATAQVFRAALAVTQTRRTTDRLIEVVVDAKHGKASPRA